MGGFPKLKFQHSNIVPLNALEAEDRFPELTSNVTVELEAEDRFPELTSNVTVELEAEDRFPGLTSNVTVGSIRTPIPMTDQEPQSFPDINGLDAEDPESKNEDNSTRRKTMHCQPPTGELRIE